MVARESSPTAGGTAGTSHEVDAGATLVALAGHSAQRAADCA
jgi:hypothetical protein